MTDDSDWQDWSPAPTGSATGSVPPTTESDWKDYDPSSSQAPKLGKAAAVATGAMNLPGARDIGAFGSTLSSYIPGAEPQTGTFAERYGENKRWLDALSAESASQHPGLYYGSAFAAGLPLMAFGAPETALGAVGVGAGLGAASGFGEGVSLSDRAKNAGIAGVLGGLGGGVMHGVTSLPSYLMRPFQSAESAATARTANALGPDLENGRGMLDPNEWAAAQSQGYPVMAADMGGAPTRALARGVANMSPEARDTLQAAAMSRASGQNQRLADTMDDIFGQSGGSLNTKVARDTIIRNAQSQNYTNYGAAYGSPNAQAIWNPELQNLMRSPGVKSVLGDAQKKAQEYAVQNNLPLPANPFVTAPDGSVSLAMGQNGQQQIPGLMYWDQVKRSLQDAESNAIGSGNRESANDWGTLKRSLTGILDQQVPQYRIARQGAMAGFNSENALDAGLAYLKETRPDNLNVMNEALAGMNPPDKGEFARGFAASVQGKALNTADNRDIVNQFNSPLMRQKFVNALGPLPAQRVEATMLWEKAMQNTNKAILGGSTTTGQLSDLGAESPFAQWSEGGRRIAEGAVAGREMAGHVGAIAGGTAAAVAHLYNQAAQKAGANPEIANLIANNLASNDPQKVNAMLSHIASRPVLMKAMRQVGNAIPLGAGPTAGAVTGTVSTPTQPPQ